MTALRLAVRGLLGAGALALVGPALLTPSGSAAGQEPTVPPSDPATTSTTIGTTTTTVCLEPQPQWPFVGTVSEKDGDRITLTVQNAPLGSLPPEVTVIFPDQGRYLDDGGQYYVVAFGPQAELEEAGAGGPSATPSSTLPAVDPAAPPADPAAAPTVPVTAPPGPLPQFLYGRVKVGDGECGALTRHADGTQIDTAVLKPLVDNWERLAWAFVVPVLAVLAALTVIVVIKRMAARAVFGPVGPPAGRRRHWPGWLRWPVRS